MKSFFSLPLVFASSFSEPRRGRTPKNTQYYSQFHKDIESRNYLLEYIRKLWKIFEVKFNFLPEMIGKKYAKNIALLLYVRRQKNHRLVFLVFNLDGMENRRGFTMYESKRRRTLEFGTWDLGFDL